MTDHPTFAPEGYELVRTIGRGASSVVWEARHLITGEPVALKILDADVSGPDALRCFAREREAMDALVRHPNILTILAADVQDGRPWLAMELCRRGSLATYVADRGPLDVPTVLRVLARLADGLAVAHEVGVVHCDIKPANVMLTDDGEPALGDFGIARVSVGRATTTTTAGFSLDHVAPELLDDGTRSPRSDVYSLGTTAWELLAGLPPFRQDDDVSIGTVLTRILHRPLPEAERVPADVLTLLRAMTAKDPDERPASMTQVGGAVRALAQERGIDLDEAALPPLTAAQPSAVEALTDRLDPDPDLDAPTVLGPEPASDPEPAPAAGSTWEPVPIHSAPDPAGGPAGRAPARRLPLVAASVIALLVSAGTAVGIHQMSHQMSSAKDAPAPAPVVIEPAAMVPTTPTTTPPPPDTTAVTSETTAARPAPSPARKRSTPQRRPVTRRPVAPAPLGNEGPAPGPSTSETPDPPGPGPSDSPDPGPPDPPDPGPSDSPDPGPSDPPDPGPSDSPSPPEVPPTDDVIGPAEPVPSAYDGN